MMNTTENTPELWMPVDVRERATRMRKQLKRSVRAIDPTYAHWREELARRLGSHVREYMGISEPESRPLLGRTASIATQDGAWAFPAPVQPPATDKAVEAASTVTAILNSADRSWNAYLTLKAIDSVRDALAQEAQEAQEAALLKEHRECPVCGEMPDTLVEGPYWAQRPAGRPVRARRLVDELAAAPLFRSCLACFVVRQAQYINDLAAGRTKGGKRRADVVRSFK